MLKKIFAFLLILFACVALSWGNITVGGDTNHELAGLNRDTDKVQEITKDEITGSLDSSVTVDNRIFSESGRKEISDQHEHFTDNVVMAGAGAIGTVGGAIKFVGDSVGLGGKEYDKYGNEIETSAIDKWKANQSGMATGIRRGGSDEAQDIIKKIDNGTATPEDLTRLTEITGDGAVNLIYSIDGEIIGLSDEYGTVYRSGANDLDNAQGYINAATGAATDSYIFLGTDAEERAHNYVGANENLAKEAATNELHYYNTVTSWTGGYSVAPGQSSGGLGSQLQTKWNQNYNIETKQTLLENTTKYNEVSNKANAVIAISPTLMLSSGGTNLLLASDAAKMIRPIGETALKTSTESAGKVSIENGIKTGIENTGKASTETVKPKSPNQLQKQVETGQAPKEVSRVDKGKIPGEKDHVHLRDGRALNKDGTFKHNKTGDTSLSNSLKNWLHKNGWGF